MKAAAGPVPPSLRQLTEAASVPFERARAMPPSAYTCHDLMQLEQDRIFARDWICLGRASAWQKPGDYQTHEVAGQPIIVLRDEDGLRAMSNVCLHRMSVLLEGSGNTRSIVCPYHAWTYNLDGSLRGAPAMERNEGFDRKDYCLPQVRCAEWLGWVFVTLNPDAPEIGAALGEVAAMIDDYHVQDYHQAFCETFAWETNWKILAENFMESYHLPVCHEATIGGLHKFDEIVAPPGAEMFNYHTLLKDDTLAIGLAHPDNTRMTGDRRRTTYLISVYPNLFVALTPGYFWYLALQPLAPGKVHVIFGGGLAKEFAASPDAKASFDALKLLLDQVNDEDKGCTEAVFAGASSPVARPGHLSHLERPIYDFMRFVASRLNG